MCIFPKVFFKKADKRDTSAIITAASFFDWLRPMHNQEAITRIFFTMEEQPMNTVTNISLTFEKKTLRKRLNILFSALFLSAFGVGWMMSQMPEGHMQRIFGISTDASFSSSGPEGSTL